MEFKGKLSIICTAPCKCRLSEPKTWKRFIVSLENKISTGKDFSIHDYGFPQQVNLSFHNFTNFIVTTKCKINS